MSIDFKPSELNQSQRQAVSHPAKYLLIVAGPGTGKTHTLTHRIVRAVRSSPQKTLALAITFTNKAAEELEDRLAQHIPACGNNILVGTFHRFCLRYLKGHVKDTNLPTALRIASLFECEALAKGLWPNLTKRQIKEKLQAMSAHKVVHFAQPLPADVAAYNGMLRRHALLDYDDVLVEAWKVLSCGVPTPFTHVFVDEYQDINYLQHALLQELVRHGAALTAIGDPHQAIYGFRGADVVFFEKFRDDFPAAQVLALSDNYRSAPNLLKASGQIVVHSPGQTMVVPPLTAKMYTQGCLKVYEAATDKGEAEYVVHQIEQMVGGTSMFSQDSGRVAAGQKAGYSFKDIAVLYRLNAQKNVLEEALARQGIPYQSCGDRPFVELPPISELVTLLREFQNQDAVGDNLSALIQRIFETSAGAAILNNRAWMDNVQRFIRMTAMFNGCNEFLDYLALQRPEDMVDPRAEYVHLMTLHASKGLEFPVVFVVGCEGGLLPLSLEGISADPIEERRLFYVGMTRAKESLFLTYASRRRLWGRSLAGGPSPFINDIERQLKEYDQAQSNRRRKEKRTCDQLELFKV